MDIRDRILGIRDKIVAKFPQSTPLEVSERDRDNSPLGDRPLPGKLAQTTTFFKELINKVQKTDTLKNDDLLIEIDRTLESNNGSRIEKFFHKFLKGIKLEDIQKINQNLDKMNRGAIQKIWPKIQGLVEMIRDPKAAWNVKALAIATLVYLISPFDAVPDLIPFAGLADDAALIIAVASTMAHELEKYLVKQAEKQAEIEIRKYNDIVRITLIGGIASAVLTIVVKLILNYLNT